MEIVVDWNRPLYEGLRPSHLCASCHDQIQQKIRAGLLTKSDGSFSLDERPNSSLSLNERCRACALSAYRSYVFDPDNEDHLCLDFQDPSDYTWIIAKQRELSDNTRSNDLYLRPIPSLDNDLPGTAPARSKL